MRIGTAKMNYSSIREKLKRGVALSDRKSKASDISRFNSEIEQIAYSSARSTGQLEGLGNLGDAGIMDQLKSGEIIPDQIFGYSSKTVLALLLLLVLFKVKKLQKGA